jgi:hypothetical protein
MNGTKHDTEAAGCYIVYVSRPRDLCKRFKPFAWDAVDVKRKRCNNGRRALQ